MSNLSPKAKVQNSIKSLFETLAHVCPNNKEKLKLVVGVSGGIDSVVLLHSLASMRKDLSLEILAAHVNHGLREESIEEEQFVKGFAEELDVDFCCVNLIPEKAGNVEAWARAARYQFFKECLSREGADYVVTAHHLNDQAETFLFRLFSGRLATSAYTIAVHDPTRKLIRPLSSLKRSEIEDYAHSQALDWAEDSSNSDLHRARNFLRHKVLPLAGEFWGESVPEKIVEVASRVNRDEAYLWEQARELYESLGRCLDREHLLKMPSALSWRMLSLEAAEQVGESRSATIGYRMLRELEKCIAGSSGRVSLGTNLWMWIEADGEIVFGDWEKEVSNGLCDDKRLSVPGVLDLGEVSAGFSLRARVITDSEEISQVNSELNLNRSSEENHQLREYFDLAQLGDEFTAKAELLIRSRRDGDVVRVWSRGRRKLKKLFREQGVKLTRRNHVPIVECGSEIIWVPGVARAEIAPVTKSSKEILCLDCNWPVNSFSSS